MGKILKNEQTVADAKIKANDMVVIMVTKKKASATPAAAPAPTESTPAATTSTTPAATTTAPTTTTAPDTTAASTTATAPAAATTTPAAGAPAATVSAASSNLVMGSNLEGMITDLMALGFPRDQVVAALRAAFNNPDRAADYLFNVTFHTMLIICAIVIDCLTLICILL